MCEYLRDRICWSDITGLTRHIALRIPEFELEFAALMMLASDLLPALLSQHARPRYSTEQGQRSAIDTPLSPSRNRIAAGEPGVAGRAGKGPKWRLCVAPRRNPTQAAAHVPLSLSPPSHLLAMLARKAGPADQYLYLMYLLVCPAWH
jgi:hypothetical protein